MTFYSERITKLSAIVFELICNRLVVCVWVALNRFGCKQADSLALVFGASTLVLSVANIPNNHLGGLIFIPLAWYFAYGKNNNTPASGISAALSIIARPTNIMSFMALVGFVFVMKKDLKKFILWAIPIFLLLLLYNFLMFDSPFKTGYSLMFKHLDGTDVGIFELFIFDLGMVSNFFAFLISPNRGIFFFSPVLIFSLLGLKKIFENADELANMVKFMCGAILLTILLFSSWAFWTGGLRYGYVVVLDIVPYFIFLISYVSEEIFGNKRMFYAFVFLSIISFSIALIGLTWGCDWCYKPEYIDYAEYRVWDINDLQVLRCFSNFLSD